jgi:hypothetical protein
MSGDNMLKTKVFIDPLSMTGDDQAERRLFSAKGEMAQILNRAAETFRHLVYWDLDSTKSGVERGDHYHEKKTENFYVLTGDFDLLLMILRLTIRKFLWSRQETGSELPPMLPMPSDPRPIHKPWNIHPSRMIQPIPTLIKCLFDRRNQ